MRLHEAIDKALEGDPLGECIRRDTWIPELRLEVSEQANSLIILDARDNSEYEWQCAVADITADDWYMAGPTIAEESRQ